MINETTGEITIENEDEMAEVSLEGVIEVGDEIIRTSGFNLEVFDCYKFISMPFVW